MSTRLCWPRLWAGLILAAFAPDLAHAQIAQTELLRAQVFFDCVDGKQRAKPAAYLLGLHPESLRGAADNRGARGSKSGDTNAINATIVIYVSINNALMPLSLRRDQQDRYVYYVDCGATHLERADFFPGLAIKLSTSEDRERLLQQLEDVAGSGKTPLLLFGDKVQAALLQLPNARQVPTYGALISGYVNRHQDTTFLSGFQGSVAIESLEPGIVSLKRIAQRAREADDAGAEAADAGADAEPVAIGETVEQRPKRKVQLRFANKALAIDLQQPGVVDTFGYCAGAITREASAQGGYVLDNCVTDGNGQIPLRIKGFELITPKIGTQPIQIDRLLRTRGYTVPYPPHWQGAATNVAEVRRGALEETVKRPLKLRQLGLAGCEVTVTPSAADLVGQTLTFPEPPCRTVDVALPHNMFGAGAPRVQGCLPGGGAEAVAQRDGRVRCVFTKAEAKAGRKAVKLAWAPGFALVELPIPFSAEGGKAVAIDVGEVSKSLRPALSYRPPREADLPIYRPAEVRYYSGQQACGKALPLKNENDLPVLAAAGCQRLPDRMDVTLDIDRAKSEKAIAFEAFKDRIVQAVALSAPNRGEYSLDPNQARLDLPIAFNAERQQKYTTQYAQAAELVFKGARIYRQPDCSDDGKLGDEVFAQVSKKADYKWPVYAQVFDNDGNALTNCAKSLVELSEKKPYLTFEFASTRAVGPRRTIILARSQDLMDKRGLPKALETALVQFVKKAHELHKQGAALSPVDVFSVSQDGAMRRVFTGEEAALEPQLAEASIAQLDRTAPKTPDLSLIRLQPETKNADRVLIVMDGSTASARNASEVRLLGSDLAARKGGGLQFFVSSDSCELWKPMSQQLRCTDLGALRQSQRETMLTDAFTGFLNPAEGK